jgi:lipid-A-disaccharide synthase-like uncharacterized protein
MTFAPLLALQIWDGFGWLGQTLFAARMLQQWLASERAGRSHVTAFFWWTSLGGSASLLVYLVYRGDPVFLSGELVSTAIYVRNLMLIRGGTEGEHVRKENPLLAVAVGFLAFVAVGVFSVVAGTKIVTFDEPPLWLALGFAGQLVWSSRFVLQWFSSERAGESVLTANFFRVSILGAVVLFAYAIHRVDWVMMAAFGLNPIPYARNLVLLRRHAER